MNYKVDISIILQMMEMHLYITLSGIHIMNCPKQTNLMDELSPCFYFFLINHTWPHWIEVKFASMMNNLLKSSDRKPDVQCTCRWFVPN